MHPGRFPRVAPRLGPFPGSPALRRDPAPTYRVPASLAPCAGAQPPLAQSAASLSPGDAAPGFPSLPTARGRSHRCSPSSLHHWRSRLHSPSSSPRTAPPCLLQGRRGGPVTPSISLLCRSGMTTRCDGHRGLPPGAAERCWGAGAAPHRPAAERPPSRSIDEWCELRAARVRV
jgi:hypothetical protein